MTLWPRAAFRHIAAVLACIGPCPTLAQNAVCPVQKGEPVEALSVNTHLELRLVDDRKLRLRGIDPPRGTPTNPQLAENARQYLVSLIAGQTLEANIAAGGQDRWGRHAATISYGATATLTAGLIEAGWARAAPGDTEPDCIPSLLKIESEARSARRGLWADPAYSILDVDSPAAFAKRGGQIVIVEGTVISTGKWRTLTFLNFSRARAGPAIVLSQRIATLLEKSGRPAAGLKGLRLRVRGQLQMRTSPRIEVYSPAAIEIIPAPEAMPSSAAAQDNEN